MSVVSNFEEITVDRQEVLRFLGLPRGVREPVQVSALLERAWDVGNSLVRYSAVQRTGSLSAAEAETGLTMELPGDPVEGQEAAGIRFASGALARHCRGCRVGTLFACTIGPGVEEEVRRLFERGEMALATTLDAFGSAAAEALAQAVDDEVAREAAEGGCKTARRYSPGYGDWSLTEQPNILKILVAKRIGLETAASGMLTPQKSVTAIIGWLPE